MSGTTADPKDDARSFLAGVHVGDVCSGTVAETSHKEIAVVLDGFPTRPLGFVGPLDVSWGPWPVAPPKPKQRITAVVTAVDSEPGRAWLSLAATEQPRLWAFLQSLRPGARLAGRIASIERYGVFVELDEGPRHPVFPGVGFLTFPELSWRRFEDATEVVRVGERVECEFLRFDTVHGEARLSLRATLPDPFQAFADTVAVGQTLRGRVTKVLPFGAFVQIAEGIEGLLRPQVLTAGDEPIGEGDEVGVVVAAVDRLRRTVGLAWTG
ncbi:S1 RNA-binding domain-containing protein [Streptomyces globosus]|jgi:small subunit ribosomal protein S1|uniref:S1 RNA-binding domain-containing protein n=1 Tax=Streptomyces globosus TaxID=68209 RepID=UPI0031DE7859